jgi:hypothetical protein
MNSMTCTLQVFRPCIAEFHAAEEMPSDCTRETAIVRLHASRHESVSRQMI